jgi:hypothetical protein
VPHLPPGFAAGAPDRDRTRRRRPRAGPGRPGAPPPDR